MQNLYIEQQKDSLSVECNFEKGLIKMSGTSYPENALSFFDPILDWLEEYIENTHNLIEVELRINYLNTSSSKCLLDFLEILEEYYVKNKKVKVKWYYKSTDRSMYEVGEEFKEDLELSFLIIEE